jgi:hypothetical protein
MAIDRDEASKNIASGTLGICAWCENFYKGPPGSGCGVSGCGDFFDTGFDKYDGPWVGKIAEHCCLCGGVAVRVFEMDGFGFGVCDDKLCMIEAEELVSGQ